MEKLFKCRCGNEPKLFKPGEQDEKQYVVQCVFCPHGPTSKADTEAEAAKQWNAAMEKFGITE